MFRRKYIIYLFVIMLTEIQCGDRPSTCLVQPFTWNNLPPLPDATGFAGSFAGVSNGALLVAGGSNFPGGGAPWKSSTKKWYNTIFVMESASGHWKAAGQLPVPLGYGVSISTGDGLVIIGGSNEKGHVANSWRLQYHGGQVQIDTMPPLPFPLANTCGALLDNKIYVAGGLTAPDSPATSNAFLVLDLLHPDDGWQALPAWPGPSRMLAVAAAARGRFYLFSGTELVNGARQYLRDAYAYTPDSGWKALAPLPNAVVAAPSPAWCNRSNELMLFGGDDGALAGKAAELREQHPGFSNAILKYNIGNNTWQPAGTIDTVHKEDAVTNPNGSTWAPVTTPLVAWEGRLVFPGGEVRPATRTPNVLSALPCE